MTTPGALSEWIFGGLWSWIGGVAALMILMRMVCLVNAARPRRIPRLVLWAMTTVAAGAGAVLLVLLYGRPLGLPITLLLLGECLFVFGDRRLRPDSRKSGAA